MPQKMIVTVYSYIELNPQAQAKAREAAQRRLMEQHEDDTAALHDNFVQQLEALGYPIDQVEFSLGHVQGDGVAFYGRADATILYKRMKGLPLDAELDERLSAFLHETVRVLIDRTSLSNHYSHWGTMRVRVAFQTLSHYIEELDDPMVEALEAWVKEDIPAVSKRLQEEGYAFLAYDDSEEALEELLLNGECADMLFYASGVVWKDQG